MTTISWHAGHREIHKQVGWVEANSNTLRYLSSYLPSWHRLLFQHTVPFVPLVVLDNLNRPWASIAVSPSGMPGFVTETSDYQLEMLIHVHPADPLHDALEFANARGTQQPSKSGLFLQNQLGSLMSDTSNSDRQLIAAMAIDFAERTRTKLAGNILSADKLNNDKWKVRLEIIHALGNCPKYINTRRIAPKAGYNPTVTHRNFIMDSDERLPDDVINTIRSTDMIYFGTTFNPKPEEAHDQSAYLGMNNRGGLPGFLRVRNDGRTVVLPDYSGNRMLMSLGNIVNDGLATFAVADLENGNVLYVTGEAMVLFGEAAKAIQPRSERIITIKVTGYLAMDNALTFGQVGQIIEDSPYTPPVRYLAEEPGHEQTVMETAKLKLSRIQLLTPDLATFTFDVSRDISVQAGQHAIIDCSPFVGRSAYSHMALPGEETSINDDSVRTWTVSSSSDIPTSRIEITMREKKGGAVTGRFFQVAHKVKELRPELLEKASELELVVDLVGIGGHFTHEEGREKIVMIAGGVGITPFLSMLSSMAREREQKRDVVLIVSTREPDVFSELVRRSLGGEVPDHIKLRFIVFSKESVREKETLITMVETGRMKAGALKSLGDLSKSEVMICGPRKWEEMVLSGLTEVGVDVGAVKRENFAY